MWCLPEQHLSGSAWNFSLIPFWCFGHWPMKTISRTCQEVVFQRCYFLYCICHLYEAPKEEFPCSLFLLGSHFVLLSSGPYYQSCKLIAFPSALAARKFWVKFSLTSNKYAGFSWTAFWILSLFLALSNFLSYTYACFSFIFILLHLIYLFNPLWMLSGSRETWKCLDGYVSYNLCSLHETGW